VFIVLTGDSGALSPLPCSKARKIHLRPGLTGLRTCRYRAACQPERSSLAEMLNPEQTLREPLVKEEKARRTPAENEPPRLAPPSASPAGMHCTMFCKQM
jgi:hypothetical protein